jgi:CoA-dependent NAD(P)H sulfur oxidoreductase
LPYYIGDVIKGEDEIVGNTLEKFRETGINVLLRTQAESIDRDNKTVRLSNNSRIPYDVLVIATGSRLLRPGIKGEDHEGVFSLKKITDALKIKRYIIDNSCRKAVIVGAGFIAMEMSEALQGLGIKVQIVNQVEFPVMRWDPELSKIILEELNKNGVDYYPNQDVIAIEKGPLTPLRLITKQMSLDADMVLLAVGIRPDARLAVDAGIITGRTGAIAVNFSQMTSDKDIFAIGDCCEVFHRVTSQWAHIPLSDIANKQSRVAGHNIAGSPDIFPGVVGSQSFKVFNLETAATGIDEQEAVSAGFHPVSHIYWGNAVGSLMGRKKIGLKLIADKSTGKLIGAQAIGETGAVSRINALAVALWSQLNIDQVAYLDFAYSPPFSSSMDAIHRAARELQKKI